MRFEEQVIWAAYLKGGAEAAAATASAPSQPKPAKPDAGRATDTEAADTPAKKAKEGETPVKPDDPKGSADPSKRTVAPIEERPEAQPAPQSGKSYTGTPSKPEDGRSAADAKPAAPKTSDGADG
jgi:NADH-quinone oxidoreductase subunit E